MKIVDTYDDIFSVYENDLFCIESWKSYAEKISPGFENKIMDDINNRVNFEKDCLPVLHYFVANKLKAKAAHDSFVNVTNEIEKKIYNKFGVELDVTIIFYLGLCNGAGWATSFNGKPAVLLGIEKIVELDWCDEKSMINLIYHELGHIWHFMYESKGRILLSKKEKAMQQLYREGVAMTFEQILCEDDDYFHQNKENWLQWCSENENQIKKEFLKRLKKGESVQDFFGDWRLYKNHSDVGYFLGNKFVRFLMQKYDFEEIAGLKMKSVLKEFYNYASV